MITLFILGTERGAYRAGFKNGLHHRDQNVRAWWPALDPSNLRGMVLSCVVVTDEAFRMTDPKSREMRNLVEALEIAKHMLRHGNQVWIDL